MAEKQPNYQWSAQNRETMINQRGFRGGVVTPPSVTA
jgi:hypothetical protein